MIKIDRIYYSYILQNTWILIFQTYRTWILDVGERLLIYLFYHQKSVQLLINLAILLRFVFVLSPFSRPTFDVDHHHHFCIQLFAADHLSNIYF